MFSRTVKVVLAEQRARSTVEWVGGLRDLFRSTDRFDTCVCILQIRTQLGMSEDDAQTGAAIACYLAQQGASLTERNQQDKSPLDVVTDPRTVEILQQFASA